MSTALGSTAQLGLARETTFGTAVTPTLFLPFVGEGVDPGLNYLRDEGLRSDTGRGYLASGRIAGKQAATAQTSVNVYNKGWGKLLRATLGSISTAQPDVGGNPTVYRHTAIPSSALGTEIYSIETGWIDAASSAYSKTAVSAMVNKCEISVSPDSIANANFDWLAQSATTASSRTSASYAASLAPLGGGLASLTIGGVAGDGINAKITIDNQLDGDRYYLGGAGQRKQPVAGRLLVTAEVDGDFADWTAFNRVLNNTYTSLVLTLTGTTISSTYKYSLTLTMNVATVGDAPKISGPGRISQPLKFEAYDDGSGPGSIITAVYQTTDSSP